MLTDFRYRVRGDTRPITVEDWRRRARRRVPDMVWAYIENGADDERTLRGNVQAFSRWRLRQRVLTGNKVRGQSLRTTVAGSDVELPILLAPTGLAGAAHWTGDLGAARAAEQSGTRLVMSSASAYSLEEVGQGTQEAHWFQLYPWRDRTVIASLISRAADAGFSTLVVTVDVPVYGNRVWEKRTGMAIPPTITPARVLSAARRPRWTCDMLRHRRLSLKNLEPVPGDRDLLGSMAVQSENLTADISWADLEWIRREWPGPLVVKGLLDADDAARAADLAVDGIVVSNHGGRQLNGTLSSLESLPAVADRVGHRVDVMMDGGVRTGADVIIARALGAKACLIGRPLLYGLAGGGPCGVVDILSILREEITRTLILMGAAGIDEVERDSVVEAGP